MPRFGLEGPWPCTIFCVALISPHTLCMNYVTNTFLLLVPQYGVNYCVLCTVKAKKVNKNMQQWIWLGFITIPLYFSFGSTTRTWKPPKYRQVIIFFFISTEHSSRTRLSAVKSKPVMTRSHVFSALFQRYTFVRALFCSRDFLYPLWLAKMITTT